MAPSQLHRAAAVLLAATLAATSSAIDFGDENDVTQTAGTVAPGKELSTSTGANGFGNFGPPTQWTASSSNNVPTSAPIVTTGGNGGWPQPTTSDTPTVWSPASGGGGNQGWAPPTSTIPPSGLTPSNGQGGGPGDQGLMSKASSAAWSPPTGESSGLSDGGWSPGGGMSLECSGSDDEANPENEYSLECSGSDGEANPENDYSLECSGSDEVPSVPAISAASGETTPTESSSNTPTVPSDTGDQQEAQTPSPASSSSTASNTASSATQGGSEVTQGGSSTTQGSSDVAQTSTSSGDVEQTSTSSGDVEQTSTSSGAHASFGKVTSKSGECVVGDPDKYISTADLNWVWENRMGVNVTTNKNWIFDHIVANKGTLNYCVRWDSTEKLSKTVASKFQAMLERQYAVWNRWLIGYGCWPYSKIKVKMVGFAVKEASLLDWTDDSLGPIYAGDLDAEGSPQCAQTCNRFFDNAPKAWTDTSSCKGEPFDLTLWPKQGLEGGLGYDWGQEVNLDNMLQTIDEEELTIVSHEIGHGFGIPDFYEVVDKPNADFPACLMMAGSSPTLTDSDGWMLRRSYDNVRSRYNFK